MSLKRFPEIHYAPDDLQLLQRMELSEGSLVPLHELL